MKSLFTFAPYAASLVLGMSALSVNAGEPLPLLSAQAQWLSAGEVTISGQSYTKLSQAPTAKTAKAVPLPMMSITTGVFAGDQLLSSDSKVGPVSVSGGFLAQLAPGVTAQQVANAHQLEVVFVGQNVALFKSQQQRELLLLLESLENDSQVDKVSLELVNGLNIPQ
ncbi:hypothetical protein [Photobacterium satsumensis]|uniref:hypothetical protein n=1 Tax=Photobacterium satsumensis TaxID=2910239 RepID=UPI003D1042E6